MPAKKYATEEERKAAIRKRDQAKYERNRVKVEQQRLEERWVDPRKKYRTEEERQQAIKEAQLRYHEKNRDTILEKARKKRAENLDEARAKGRESDKRRDRTKRNATAARYRSNNPEKIKAGQAKYREDPEHKEKARIVSRTWREEHPEETKGHGLRRYDEHRDEVLAYQKKRYEENPDSFLQYSANYRKEHPEATRQAVKKWNKEHPEQVRLLGGICRARRVARKKGLPSFWTQEHRDFAWHYWGNCCAVCDTGLDGFFHTGASDHWIALSSKNCPGTVPTNMLPLCHGQWGCNNQKHAKDPVEWLIDQYGKRKASVILKRINAYFDIVRDKFPLPEVAHDNSADDAATLSV